VVITTPGSNPENHYAELVKQGEAILAGEVEDDTVLPILYGLDPSDQLDEEATWAKANPGLEHGQPDLVSLRRSWNTMKRSAMGRAEFSRYHAARMSEDTGGWLDMALWPGGRRSTGRRCAGGRRGAGSTSVQVARHDRARRVAVPLDDGRVALRGHYWWPKADVAQRELDYRMPVRTWALEGKMTLTPGREIDYEAVRTTLLAVREEFDVRSVGYDAWGSSTSPSSSRRTASRSSSTGWGSRPSVPAATCSRTFGRARASWSATTPSFAAPAPRRTQRGPEREHPPGQVARALHDRPARRLDHRVPCVGRHARELLRRGSISSTFLRGAAFRS
jgi:hypothetical protein